MTCLIWRQHRGQALWTIITVTALVRQPPFAS